MPPTSPAAPRGPLLALAAVALLLPGGSEAAAQTRDGGCAVHGALWGVAGARRQVEHLGDSLVGSHVGFATGRSRAAACDAAGTVAPLPAQLRLTGNSAYAVDRNNGAVWAGRGVSAGLGAGAAFRWSRVTAHLRPEAYHHENRGFELADPYMRALSPFAYSGSGHIDWPQRPGDGSFLRVVPGESFVEVTLPYVRAGVSTATLWLGPAGRYPLLFSNTGEGFPRLVLETASPVGVGLGTLDFTLLVGRLEESGHFDADPTNDHRALSAVALTLEPYRAPGVTVGAALARHQTVEDLPTLGSVASLFRGPFSFLRGGDDAENGLASMFLDWVEPASRFRFFVEWGREDFFFDLNELAAEPDRASGYTAGFSKAFARGQRDLLLTAEATRLYVARGTWYVNSDVLQGHTHRGQLLGSYIGPGSDAQYVSLTALGPDPARSVGAYVERVRRDEWEYEQRHEGTYGFRGHDVEVRGGVTLSRSLGPLVIDGAGGVAFRRNRLFIGLDGVSRDFDWAANVEADVTVWWVPGG